MEIYNLKFFIFIRIQVVASLNSKKLQLKLS